MATNVQVVSEWLEQHHGLHRPASIARHTGLDSHTAAMTCRYMWEMGRIERVQVQMRSDGKKYGLYGVIFGKVRSKGRNPWTNEPMTTQVIVNRSGEGA